MNKEIRPYQEDCHEAVISDYNSGLNKLLITIFTGGGKTYTLIKLIERMGFKRVLWLSFQTELISQSAMAFIADKHPEIYDYVNEIGFLQYAKQKNSKIGCIKEDVFNIEPEVVMGSIMTIHRRLDRFPSDYFDCIVCDESHLFMSNTAFKTVTSLNPKLLIGCTATPTRSDGLPLSDLFQKISYDYDLGRGIKDGWACEMDAIRIKTNCSLDNVKTTAGELNLKDLTNEVNTISRNQLIVDSYKKYCEGRPCIAFCVDIKHAINLAEQFKMNGFDCEAVSSDEELTPGRSEKIKRFKEGKLNIITNVSILTTGFDKPDTGAIIMACPTKSLTKYLQCAGRGSRLKSEAFVERFGQNCIIVDIVDSTRRHNLINAWELDKEKDVEDRWFVSQEKKDKLLAERKRKALITHEQKEDERVKLLALPKVKIYKTFRTNEDATEKQLLQIEKWGYPIKDVHYNKWMISEIFGKQQASESSVRKLKEAGYAVDGFVSVSQVQLAEKEIANRKIKQK